MKICEEKRQENDASDFWQVWRSVDETETYLVVLLIKD